MALKPFVAEGLRAGYRRTATYEAERVGLFPPRIHIGRNAYIPAHETDAIIAARIAGADDAKIKELVADLVRARTPNTIAA